MRRALDLAERGVGWTRPNPAVGAVAVREGRLIGEGWHRAAGGPHAEIECFRAAEGAGETVEGATLYVTLEPCSTTGRTPPCTDAIVARGVRRVCVGAVDPNPLHAGRGLVQLEQRGIAVRRGVLETECMALNRGFNRWIVTRRPWVIVKLAITRDGWLALPPGQGRWITGEEARADVHRLRARCDAIAVGTGTVLADDPALTVRDVPCLEQPWRVIVAGRRPIPQTAQLFNDRWRDRTWVIRDQGWPAILAALGERGVQMLMVEGGQQIAESAAAGGIVDELWLYVSPATIADAGSLPHARHFLDGVRLAEWEAAALGADVRISGRVDREGGTSVSDIVAQAFNGGEWLAETPRASIA